jgi:predicted DNA-binding antitoxin AbrB/MazE fold protein
MTASNIIECIYEGGVFKPLERVDMKEGTKLRLRVEKFDISKFCGAFGEGSMEEYETFEEEAQM